MRVLSFFRTPAFHPGLWLVPLLLLAVSAPLWLHWWEPQCFLALNAAFAPVSAYLWAGLSLLGNGWGILGLTAPLLVLAPRLLWAWLCAAPFAIVFARVGKDWFDSPRPAAVIDPQHIRIVGETLHNVAMPSGHTLTAFAVASALYFALPRIGRWRYSWLWLLAAGAGLSRIAVGAHWPGDVAVGASLGIVAGLLGQLLLQRLPARCYTPTGWPLRVVAGLVALALYHLVWDTLDFSENHATQGVLAVLTGVSLLAFLRATVRPPSG